MLDMQTTQQMQVILACQLEKEFLASYQRMLDNTGEQ